mmetsp:Transcript_23842/g.71193  ORF Transcript_23842/g.71193 Transcript_23842/m.71193 type:complete len:159 (+) Transcript_23842:94-570(+)|eukprot:CAMPEP_0175213342 /NCGR_PEP_ID=MMETSP0093-20121207/16140_1 /TAXON_ID=311494 /ORGANISM="Alexandrium monilatum, Strain CCMP3105" /LENGTH=158 /DNA_ID=CAMNT_0016506657 /DNA_START=88 /DNA_END=564 /DNA_ORIENTATION=+
MGGVCCTDDHQKYGATTVEAERQSTHLDEDEEYGDAVVEPDEEEPAALEDETVFEDTGEPAPLEDEAKDEAGRTVTLLFQKSDGVEHEVLVSRKPLGIDFKREVPLKVLTVRAGSAGADYEISAGWTLLAINGADVTTCTFSNVLDLLRESFARVPPD